ncbi:cadmium-translocating P-type ATPase [Amylibacter sp. SFDW26]|uniref:heavy metal translocating P-type ATPase n=1 Tax=Amylibacter sp. SFDW26 TaxID=2652722 RepID=UPI0012622076|nr:heavy metal translocating P-type ATPase [Amylibacter sp. SFDW26]KAB7614279.1 cadmium-translocating P-type ATPase [Amylibacter sp. SFDW26]
MTAACPACSAMSSEQINHIVESIHQSEFSIPTVHCAACISAIERGIGKLEGVTAVRVNLSMKRATVHHNGQPRIDDAILDRLVNLGFDAQPLDRKMLNKNKDDVAFGLLIRLGVSGFAAMNVMLLSVSVWAGADGATRDFLHWVSAAIALPTVAYASQPFFKNAWAALSAKRLNMDVPISLAILMAVALSLYETIHSGRHAYFDAALSLTFFLLAGRFLDHQTRAKARSAAVELSALEMPTAQRMQDGIVETVDVEKLNIGDRVLIRRGARIPVDGVVAEGRSELDMSLITGETMPHVVKIGDPVYSGTINMAAPFQVDVTQIGNGTKLAEITALVASAETLKTKYTTLADRAAQIYAPVVHLLALAAFVFWQLWTGDTRLAVGIATAVLIITCPCALGLAVPAVMTAASGRLFRSGVLIKDGSALERLVDVDTVVFDKTGTLTKGEMTVLSAPTGRALQIAASLAASSDHPQSRAILRHYGSNKLTAITDIIEHPGQGLEAKVDGRIVKLGRADWIGVSPKTDHVQSWLCIDGEQPVPFLFEDTLKDTAVATIKRLQARGLKVVMLSGDTQFATDQLALKLGVDQAIGGTLPDQKMAVVKSLGDHVLMVGDGLNDTAALASAYVSMSPATAIDAARAASDFVLIKDDLTLIDDCVSLSKSAKRRMLENFGIAAGYNAIAIPIALTGLATPLLAAVAMSASSICVSLNALRLKERS